MKPFQPVSVDGIEFDALIDEARDLNADIPDYPTDQGFDVSDTITNHPLLLNMTLAVTDTPVTWRLRHGARPGRSEQVLERLEQAYARRQLVTVITSKKTYSNMGITNIHIPRNLESGKSYKVTISFKQVRVTKSKTVSIPAEYGKSGGTGISAGSVSTGGGGGGGIGAVGKSPAYQQGFALFGG